IDACADADDARCGDARCDCAASFTRGARVRPVAARSARRARARVVHDVPQRGLPRAAAAHARAVEEDVGEDAEVRRARERRASGPARDVAWLDVHARSAGSPGARRRRAGALVALTDRVRVPKGAGGAILDDVRMPLALVALVALAALATLAS